MSRKYYVVWIGRQPGIYETWDECEAQTKGFPGARFKSFSSLNEATAAFVHEPETIPQTETKNHVKDPRGWKPDNECPEDVQEVLQRIRG